MLSLQLFWHRSPPSALPRGENQDEACGELTEFAGAVCMIAGVWGGSRLKTHG